VRNILLEATPRFSRYPLFRILSWLLNLRSISIFHIGIFRFSGLLGFLLGLQLGLNLSAFLSSLRFLLSEDGLSLLFDFIAITLDDYPSDGADFFDLGNVDGLCCILTFIIKPVLRSLLDMQ
jgi:hypothetical protein